MKSLFAASSIIPIILRPNVAVVAMDETDKAEELLTVFVDHELADVPKEAFAKTPVKAVALSVREASLATWNN